MSAVRPCHSTRNFCDFCNTSVPVPGTSVSSVRSPWVPLPGTSVTSGKTGTIPAVRVCLCYSTRGARYSFRFNPKSALCIMTSCLVSHTFRTPKSTYNNSTCSCLFRFYGHILTMDTFEIENVIFFMNRIEFDSIWWKNTFFNYFFNPPADG